MPSHHYKWFAIPFVLVGALLASCLGRLVLVALIFALLFAVDMGTKYWEHCDPVIGMDAGAFFRGPSCVSPWTSPLEEIWRGHSPADYVQIGLERDGMFAVWRDSRWIVNINTATNKIEGIARWKGAIKGPTQ
jgi:hypothetical protein